MFRYSRILVILPEPASLITIIIDVRVHIYRYQDLPYLGRGGEFILSAATIRSAQLFLSDLRLLDRERTGKFLLAKG